MQNPVRVNCVGNMKPHAKHPSVHYIADAGVDASGAWLVRDIRGFTIAEGHLVGVQSTLTWADAIGALCAGHLGPFLDECLCASPHAPALFWETPSFSRSTLSLPFEFVTLPAPHLACRPSDGGAFAAHFGVTAQCSTATFTNLRGDATLVVPCPPRGSSALRAPTHGHLGAFVCSAPAAQRDAFWCAVGAAAREAAKADGPTWMSTAGSGVPWLHVRFDARPTYYRHTDYARRGR